MDTMERNLQLPDFLVIPSVLIRDRELRPTDPLIYGVVYWYSKLKLEKCILSNKSFSELLNVSERAIQYGLQRMSARGYLAVIYEDDTKKVRKEIIPLIMFSVNEAKLVDHMNIRSSTPRQMFTPPSTNVHHNNIDLIREVNNTKKEIIAKKENKYQQIEDVTEQDLQEIAEHYRVPLAFVKSKHEDMILWAGSRPTNGKLRGRNWRLTLMNWVKRDAVQMAERRAINGSKRGIDARNIQ